MRTYFTYVLIGLFCICANHQITAQSSRKDVSKNSAQQATQQNNSNNAVIYKTRAEKYAAEGLVAPGSKSKTKASTPGNIQSGGTYKDESSVNVSSSGRCSTDEALEKRLQDPAYSAYRANLASAVSTDKLNSIACDAGNSIIIPVAVHFNNAYNTTDIACIEAAIDAQIASLNADFAAENADILKYSEILENCSPSEECVASDGVCITFCVADQNHPASSGLNDGDMAYTIGVFNGGGFGAGGSGAGADWAGYLNMFVIDGLGFGVADGIPGAVNGDGVSQDGSFFGGPGFTPCSSGGMLNDDAFWNLGRTMTHEVGHYLGLYHTFQGGCGDEPQSPYPVTDTPPQANSSSGCPASTACGTLSGCSAGESVQYNYMDYFDDACLVMFSQEQAAAMNTFANAATWAADKVSCTLPTYSPIAACSFRAAFDPADGTPITICTDDGTSIQFADASSTTATSWNWTFTITSGDATIDIASSTNENPIINVTSGDGTSGTLEVTLTSSDGTTTEVTTQTYPVTIVSGDNCPNECDYALNLTDTFGDGWDGASIEIFQDGVSTGVYTVAASADNFVLTLTDGATIDLVYTAGAFENEHLYELIDPFGNTIFSDGPNPGAGTSFVAYCSAPTCDDGLQNGEEGGVDCGGTSLCPDCCGNGVQDDGETGVDCGGAVCAVCPTCPTDFLIVSEETFDGCAQPADWTVSSTGTSSVANGDFSFSTAAGGLPFPFTDEPADFTGCVAVMNDDNDAASVGVHCIVTPVTDITAYINTSLSFDWLHDELGGSIFNVDVYDGTAWVNVFSSNADGSANNETVALDAYANPAFQIRFCYDDAGGWNWGIAIDNVSICGQPNDMCPTEITTNDISGDYCDSTGAMVSANANPNVTYAWSSDNPNVVIVDATASTTAVEFTAPTQCTVETATISVIATCVLDGTTFSSTAGTVNVYPAPPATPEDLEALLTLNEGTCMDPVTVSVGCEDFITLVPDAANPTFPVNSGDMGTANYTATYAPALNCCPDVSGATNDIILDGDFESGAPGNGWTEFSDQPFPVIDGTFPLNGSFDIWLGGLAVGITNVQQTITIPSTAAAADLSFNIAAGQCDCAGGDDMQVVINGTVVWSLCNPVAGQVESETTICGLTDPSTQTFVSVGPIDVTAFADGNPYVLEINSFEAADDGINTSIFVDDVALIVEEPAGVDPCTTAVSGDYNCAGCTATSPTISTTSNTDICTGDGAPDMIDVTVDVPGMGNPAWVITDANGIVLALPAAPPFDLEGAGAGTCLIWLVNIDDEDFEIALGDDAAAVVAAFCAELSNEITVTRADNCAPMVSVTDPCDCDNGIDLDGDGFNDILVETITVMPGAPPYSVTDYSGGLVDMSGADLDQAALDALLGAAVPDADGNVSVSVYIPTMTVYSIQVTDGNGAVVDYTKPSGCTTCAPLEDVPTVGEWGLIILGLLMTIVSIVGIRERRKVYA